jgi:tetratricopeptide (TPR) repeat protein
MMTTTVRMTATGITLLAILFLILSTSPISGQAPERKSRTSRLSYPVTFNQDIAPIMYRFCAECHHPGGPAPFSLLEYQDVKKRAQQIVTVTKSGYMPPWLPEPGYGEFVGERRLGQQQIETIRRWVEQGMPEGPSTALRAPPKFTEGWQLGQPDLIVKLSTPYILAAEGTDVFRNFVIPVPVSTTHYVRAIEILPGNKKVVHHANMLVDRSQSSRRLDAKDPEPGFSGMDLRVESNIFDPDSHFLFWKPGTPPYTEPEGMTWRLDKGTDLVLNMHMQPSGKPETIQPIVGLYFSDKPPTRFPMLLQLENDGVLDIPAGAKNFVVTEQYTLPLDVDLLGVYPHAHYLGRELQALAVLPDGTQKWIIRINDWDINWQAVYRYRKPAFLPKGTIVKMRYTYDNSAGNIRNPNRPPRRVVAGDKSSDEMAHLWIQVLPRGNRDLRVVLQESWMRHRLRKYPNDFTAQFNLAGALQSMGRIAEAIGYYEGALRVRPNDAVARNSLGTALQKTGKLEEAVVQYREVLRIMPDYSNARYNLGTSLMLLGRPEEAQAHFIEVLRMEPEDADAHNDLGSALAMTGELSKAAVHFEKAIKAKPDHVNAHYNLGKLFAIQGDHVKAAIHFERSVQLDPDNADAHNDLGELLLARGEAYRALEHFRKALRIDRDHSAARENIDRARALMRKP